MKLSWKPLIAVVALALASAGCTTVIRSSVSSNGESAIGGVQALLNQSISDSGRFTAFSTAAPNLVPGDTNGVTDVFRHDNVTGQTTRVSLKDDGGQFPAGSLGWAMAGNGDQVAFVTSQALEPSDTNQADDVYVRTISAGTTERASLRPDGSPILPAGSFNALRRVALSDDGRYVVMVDSLPNQSNVYVRDLTADTTTVIPGPAADAHISGDGAWVTVNDLCTGGPCSFTANLVSRDGATAEPIAPECGFEALDVTADARYVIGRRFGVFPTFECAQPDGLVRWDRSTKQLTEIGVETNQANAATISNDGRFASVLDDGGFLYVVDLKTGVQQPGDTSFAGQRRGTTGQGGISGNGRYLVVVTENELDGGPPAFFSAFTRYAVVPTVTAATPATVAPGASHVTVRFDGAELLPGATVVFPDTGITVHSVKVVNPTRIDVELSVPASTPTGPARAVVTNTGLFGGSHTICSCLTVS